MNSEKLYTLNLNKIDLNTIWISLSYKFCCVWVIMLWVLYNGFTVSLGSTLSISIFLNFLLIQFPILHSYFQIMEERFLDYFPQKIMLKLWRLLFTLLLHLFSYCYYLYSGLLVVLLYTNLTIHLIFLIFYYLVWVGFF